MITSIYRDELEEVLAWDWRIDPGLCMPDKQNRPPRSARPKTNEDRLDLVEQELRTIKESTKNLSPSKDQIENLSNSIEMINLKIEKLLNKKTLWTKALEWYWSERSWSIAVSLVIFSFIGWAFQFIAGSFIDQHTSEIRTNVGNISSRVSRIEGALLKERASTSPGTALNEIRNLDEETFAKSLPALNIVTQKPIQEVRPDDSTLQAISQKLYDTDQSTPDYWQAVLQFINFAGSRPIQGVPPTGSPNFVFKDSSVSQPLNFVRQIILLDGGDLSSVRFDHCRIILTENPVRMRNVEFIDCVFEVPATASPNEYLKRATRELLASNLTKIG